MVSVLLISFVLAIPASSETYKNFKDPGCHTIGATACRFVIYCKNRSRRGDLFTTRGYLKGRGAPKPENNLNLNLIDALSPSLTTLLSRQELGLIGKRASSSVCGVLSRDHEISDTIGNLVPGMYYDLIVRLPI